MKGRIQDLNLVELKDIKIKDVVLNEFNIEIVFEGDHSLVIEEYWEYVDEKEQVIDRQLSSKFRKEFKLKEVVGSQFIKLSKVLETFYFGFSNKNSLKVSAPDFEFMNLDHYKAFGDDSAPSGV